MSGSVNVVDPLPLPHGNTVADTVVLAVAALLTTIAEDDEILTMVVPVGIQEASTASPTAIMEVDTQPLRVVELVVHSTLELVIVMAERSSG